MRAGLADLGAVQCCYLVRANYQAAGVLAGNGMRLFPGQPLGSCFGCFTGAGGFVDIRRANRKRQAQACQ